MQLTCPCCFARFAIEAALNDQAARDAVAAAMKLPPPLGDLLLAYIGMFRPPKRALEWKRAAAIMNELLTAIASGRVERHGRTWAAPIDAWRYALEEMQQQRDKLQLPLKTNGYLFSIIAAQANKTEAREEHRVEEQRRHRGDVKESSPRKVDAMVEEHLANLRGATKR